MQIASCEYTFNSVRNLLMYILQPPSPHYRLGHDTFIFIDDFVHRMSCYASQVRCDIYIYIYIYIYMDPYMYYLEYDAVMLYMCKMVLWHIWRCYVWYVIYMIYIYIYYVSLSVCHLPLVIHNLPHRKFLQIDLDWCILSKFSWHSTDSIYLNYCSTAHNCGGA